MDNVNFGSNAVKFGLFIGIFNIVLTLLFYVFNIDVFSYTFIGLNIVFGLGIVVSFFVFGVKSYRQKALAGKITFWQAFAQGLAIGIIGYAIIGAFSYIFNAYIAPEYMAQQLDGFIEFMEGFNLPDEAFDQAISEFENNMSPMSQLLSNLKSGAIMSLIVSLIVGFAIKKDTTETQIV